MDLTKRRYILNPAYAFRGFKLLPYAVQNLFFPHTEFFKESVQWSITGRCNYRCRHCFMSAPHAAQGEPDWSELMAMLDAFCRCGIRNISLTGGEPMFRRNFWQLVDEILRRGINITTLYSNGLLITDVFLDELQKRHIRPCVRRSADFSPAP